MSKKHPGGRPKSAHPLRGPRAIRLSDELETRAITDMARMSRETGLPVTFSDYARLGIELLLKTRGAAS